MGGFVGMLRASSVPKGPVSPLGAELELGSDAGSAMGRLFGSTIDDAIGAGGLGLSGEGSGGGPLLGQGVGRHSSGPLTIGGGTGVSDFGADRGLPGGHHRANSPRIRPAGVTETRGGAQPARSSMKGGQVANSSCAAIRSA